MALILHIAYQDDWQKALYAGYYSPPSLKSEDFIHFSSPAQILGTLQRFYRGQLDLLPFVVETSQLAADLHYEEPVHTPDISDDAQFPHLYGPLNLDAVIHTASLAPEPDGTFTLPAEIRVLL